jgi:hypothetical protein
MVAICSGREKHETATPATRPHDLSLLQKVDKVIGFGGGGKTNCPKFVKTIVYCMFFTHVTSRKIRVRGFEGSSEILLKKRVMLKSCT